jgi:hypothetical protein
MRRMVSTFGKLEVRVRAICSFALLAIPFLCQAEVNYKNHYIRIHLKDDWIQIQSLTKSQLSFSSMMHSAGITISETRLSTSDSDLHRVADELIRIRIEVEKELQPNSAISYSKPWSTKYDDGLQVNYMGHDDQGRYFFFTGFIVKKRVISVYGELNDGSESSLRRFFQETLSSIEYQIE